MNINSHVQLPNCVLRNFRDETDPEKKVWCLDVQTGDILRICRLMVGRATKAMMAASRILRIPNRNRLLSFILIDSFN